MIAATLLCAAISPAYAATPQPSRANPGRAPSITTPDDVPKQKAAVLSYWNAIDENDWARWVRCYAPPLRAEYESFAFNPTNQEEGMGVLAIKSAQVISMERVDDMYALMFYKDLHTYYSSGSYACYLVEINTFVKPENDYFSTGKSKHICIIVKDDAGWHMGTIYAYSTEYENALRGVTNDFVDFITQPTTITIKDKKGVIHKNISFTEAIVNITCNEIGAMGYKTDAVYANIMAIKMLCWWAKVAKFQEGDGYDIGYPNVTYLDHFNTNASQTKTIRSAVDVMKPYYMVSSSQTGSKLFDSDYDGYASKGKGSGTLSQPESQKMALNGKTWQEILHYFYDNSAFNNPNVGIVKIGHECKFAKASSYSSNSTQHWLACKICGAKITVVNHTWVQYTGYAKCSVCGRLKEVAASSIMNYLK